ncbi:ABC transporter permease subunit [Paenibacillus filicis]|uniref:ABC transporter permease subunit n=1 Tax=Paenibacillus gyeongsangnamensis TaxID=3388067 RepID=A0ABT4Q4I2_9BACL|nr:ABC transporter permease subunit [Paenibacillus filicis]MCZ8511716.1 ABC transporter permease subunit [Paenibacillus filicis]
MEKIKEISNIDENAGRARPEMAVLPKTRTNRRINLWNRYKYCYLLLLPGIVYFLLFHYVPMLGMLIAFKDYKITKGILGSEWAGFKWFELLFAAEDFWLALKNTILISFYKLIFGFPVPIVLALLLNEVLKPSMKRIIQTIVYFPHFVSWVILGGIMFTLFSSSTGLLSLFGLHTSPLTQPETFRSVLVASDIWKEAGWGTVIYMAAISGINPELYEAARMDGANRFDAMRYVTIPSIRTTIYILLILKTGHILNAGFDQVFVLYNALVYQVADILDTYVYRVGISVGRFSLAAAAGLFKSVVGLMLVLATNWIIRRLGGLGLW